MDLSNLVQKAQEERSTVALNIFLERSATDDLKDLQQYVPNANIIEAVRLGMTPQWHHSGTSSFL